MIPTNRRRLLAAVGAASGGSLLGGCLDRLSTAADGNGGSAPEGFPSNCPDYDVEEVVCFDHVDPDEVDAFLDPSARVFGPGESIEFSLRNRGDRTLDTNFNNWKIHKYVDGDWYHVAPQEWIQPLMGIAPGESHTWTVTVDNEGIEAGEPVPTVSATEDVGLAGIGGGHYAFRGRGWFEADGHEDDVAFAATFEFDADSLELAPTNAISGTEWDGDVLVAHSARGDPDDEDARLGAFELERVDEPDAERLITEQVLRRDRLRDVLALAEDHDADRVRLEEYDTGIPIFGSRSDGTFAYGDEQYEVTTRELDEGE